MSDKSATVQVGWSTDESAFFRSVVDAAASSTGFRGSQASALYEPFHDPAIAFHRRSVGYQPGQKVKLLVSYSPGRKPPVTIKAASTEGAGSGTAGQLAGALMKRAAAPITAPPDKWAQSVTGLIEQCGESVVLVDFVVTSAALDLRLFQALPGGSASRSGKGVAAKAVNGLMGLLRASQNASNPKIYTARFSLRNGEWGLERVQKIAEVQPIPKNAPVHSDGAVVYDEGQALIDDVHSNRRLVLDTAAMLIAEQDPTRLDNLLMSIAPFGLMKIGKLAKLARLSKAAILKRIRAPRFFQLRRGRYHVDVKPDKNLFEHALQKRINHYGVEVDDFKRNVTVWDVTIDGKRQLLDEGNIPISELNRTHPKIDKDAADVGLHSEAMMKARLQQHGLGKGRVKVHAIYTERICCANCKSLLEDEKLINVPVYHSVNEVDEGTRAEALMRAYHIID